MNNPEDAYMGRDYQEATDEQERQAAAHYVARSAVHRQLLRDIEMAASESESVARLELALEILRKQEQQAA